MILTFYRDVPLELTMVFEDCYEDALAMTVEEKEEVCQHALWMNVNGVLAGEIYGADIGNIKEEIEDCAGENSRTVYCYSVTILPHLQKKGLGAILHAYWLGMLAGRTIVGHATSPSMMHLATKFGAKFFNAHKNWYGTERTAIFYKILPT